VATSGTVESDSQAEQVRVPGGVLPGTAVLETTVSSSVLSGVEEALNWLVDYPYGCLEQRLSRLVPLLLAGDLLTASARTDLDEQALKSRVQAELDELASFQVEAGGFSLWAGGDRVHDELTAYAVRTLLEARERGFQVEEGMLTRARAAMKKALNQERGDYPLSPAEILTVRASLLEALTRMEYRDPATLSALFKERDQLSLDAKVHLLRAAWRMDNATVVGELRRDLQNLARVEAQTAWYEDPVPQPWLFASSVRTTGLVLEAFLEQGEAPLAPRMVRWLMEARRDGHWGTTRQDAAALRALLAYRSRFESQDPDLEATVQVAGRGILQARLNSKAPLASSRTPLEEGKVGEALEVHFGRRGRGTLHYDLRLRYAPEKDPPARDEGFTHVAIQSLHTIAGEEFHDLRRTVGAFQMMGGMQRILLGAPLLATQEDMARAVEAILATLPRERKADEAVVLMGHGTPHPANAFYAALMFQVQRKDPNVFIGCVEGYPDIHEVQALLTERKIRKVYLMPFMSVAGDHAKNDMTGDDEDSWKSVLTRAGFACQAILKGTAEYDVFVDIWVDHLGGALGHF
jgi:cobalamin biosynthesis Co2+ chelatase CbiK